MKAESKYRSNIQLNFLGAIQPGDYVVHIEHGIGQFVQIEKRTIGTLTREYLKILYAGGDTILVPIDQIDRLAKYQVPLGKTPELTRLGGKKWEEIIKNVQKETAKIAKELLTTAAKRSLKPGIPLAGNTEWMQKFQDAFPYEDTPDQESCWKEISEDMASSVSMDRILCGDVGFGKTELAMRAAMQTALSGYQTALIAPTSILVRQHFRTFSERFADFPIRIAYLAKGQSASEQKSILEELARGDIHIILGTHRLFGNDVQFEKLGLLIIDEEQRFGVEQKEIIKRESENINILSLSATPIPRTLNFGLAGMKTISLLTTPPPGRLPIHTEIKPYSMEFVAEAIFREWKRGGQCYILFNRIRGMELFAHQLRKALDALMCDANIITIHGQLPSDELEDRLQSFIDKKFLILISTTIIENGIDLPNANSILILHAERFGLAQLHQLRGRVGRSDMQGFAYLLYHNEKQTPEAEARLTAIATHNQLGDGFAIAAADLDIRGAGSLLGIEQHGMIESIGITHYMNLLREEVERQKLGYAKIKEHIRIDVPLSGYIPETYIGNVEEKIRIYQKLGTCDSLEEMQKTRTHIEDIYGPIPAEMEDIFRILRLKFALRDWGFGSLKYYKRIGNQNVIEITIDFDVVFVPKVMEFIGNNIYWVFTSKGIYIPVEKIGGRFWYTELMTLLEKKHM